MNVDKNIMLLQTDEKNEIVEGNDDINKLEREV
jgi:hypothetical protein